MNTFPLHFGFRRTVTSIAIKRLFLVAVIVTCCTVSALAQDIQKLDPALEQLVGPDSKLERIATGFNKWTEGPVWTRRRNSPVCGDPRKQHRHLDSGEGRERFHAPQRIYRCRAIQRDGARLKWNDPGS